MARDPFLPRRRNSILYLVVLAFLLNLIPLYALSAFFYRRAYNTVETMSTQTMMDNQQYRMEELYNQIFGLWHSLYTTENSRGAAIASMEGSQSYGVSEMFHSKLEVLNYIANIAAGYEIVEDIAVYFASNQTAIRLSGGIGPMAADEVEWLNTITPRKNQLLVFSQRDIMLIPSLASRNYTQKEGALPLIVAAARISPEKILQQIIPKDRGWQNVHAFLIRNHDDRVLAALSRDDAGGVIPYEDLPRVEGDGYVRTTFQGRPCFLFTSISEQLGVAVCEIVPDEYILGDINVLENWYILAMTVLLSATVFLLYCIYAMIYRPANLLKAGFVRSEKGELGVTLPVARVPLEFAQMYLAFNNMTKGIQRMVKRDYAQQILMQEAVIKQLQFQINPHFLYNSFFILHSMIRNEDYESAEEMTKLLGIYLEYITKDNENLVPLSKEVEHARAYTNIQLLRFEQRIRVEFADLPPEWGSIRVPKLVLQPLIENAFQHGLKNVVRDGLIRVFYAFDGYVLYIQVDDNGAGMTDEDIARIRDGIAAQDSRSEGVALSNIQRRLDIRFGHKSGLYVARSDLGGLSVTIRMAVQGKEG